MISNRQVQRLLRRAALSAAILLTAAPAALADPPGYLFQDFERTPPAVVSAPLTPRQDAAANQEAGSLSSSRSSANARESSPWMMREHAASAAGSALDPSKRPSDSHYEAR